MEARYSDWCGFWDVLYWYMSLEQMGASEKADGNVQESLFRKELTGQIPSAYRSGQKFPVNNSPTKSGLRLDTIALDVQRPGDSSVIRKTMISGSRSISNCTFIRTMRILSQAVPPRIRQSDTSKTIWASSMPM
jgi:hypothetical protein